MVNEERTDRGLPPIDYITSQLDAYAQAGANGGTDPPSPPRSRVEPVSPGAVPSGPVGCRTPSRPTSTGCTTTAGVARPTTNELCSPSNPSECWGHRDIILHEFANCPSGPPVLSMGAAYSPNGYNGGSLAAIFVSSCQVPSDVTISWGQAATQVASNSRTIGIAPLPNGTGYWEAEANGTVAAFGSAAKLGSLSGALNAPIVGIAATPDGGGYWLVGPTAASSASATPTSTARPARCG